ncbi:MAG: hypothetical protein ACXWFF_05325 [Methylomonas sp.]
MMPGRYLDWQWLRDGEKIAAIGVRVESGKLRLIYNYRRNDGDWESLDYPVMLQTTACHYGGMRYWFTCPAAGCGRRVAVLYQGGKYFACRHCYQLAYKSQRETPDDRADRRANKIRDQLNWPRGILNDIGWKPKGMHWKTFNRLMKQYHAESNQVLMGIAAKMKIVDSKFSAIEEELNRNF